MLELSQELLTRANIALVRLKLLSDAKTSGRISAIGHQQKATASPPPEARLTDEKGPPPKDRSLYEWYLWQFRKATSEHRFRVLVYLAERDYERARRRPSDARRGPISLRGKDGAEAEQEAMRRVIEWYAGVPPIEVAILEEVSEQHVRKARRVFRVDEETGERKQGWKGWDDEARREVVAEYREGGYTQQEIADNLQISERTVRRYWKKKVTAA